MMPAPTQLLIDGSVELRNSGWWTAPLLLPLAYLTYRLHGMLLRVGRASATPSAVYAALTNAALALVLVLFAAACALPIFGLHSRIR
jgi:hypothetical protein